MEMIIKQKNQFNTFMKALKIKQNKIVLRLLERV